MPFMFDKFHLKLYVYINIASVLYHKFNTNFYLINGGERDFHIRIQNSTHQKYIYRLLQQLTHE